MDHITAKYHASRIAEEMAAAFWLDHVCHHGGDEEAQSAAGAKDLMESNARESLAELAEAMGFTLVSRVKDAA